MDNKPQSAIRPTIREELMNESAMSPRQIQSSTSTTTTSIITYSENRSSSMSSASPSTTGGMILTPDTMIMPPATSPSLLKRSSSWKKFKNTVKETVTGIVNLSVNQNPATGGSIDNPQHLCENLTPDLEQKLIHCSNEEIYQPQFEDMPSALERLEKQADAAFAAAAASKFPQQQSSSLMLQLLSW